MNLVRFTAYYLELCDQVNDLSDGHWNTFDGVSQIYATAIEKRRDAHSKPLGCSEKVLNIMQRIYIRLGGLYRGRSRR
ncbi:hypothetical protein FPOAC2_01108 [Fusarium poae]